MCRACPGGDGLFATIESAKEAAANTSDKLLVTTRPEKDIFGAALADEVRSEIRSADVLVCDNGHRRGIKTARLPLSWVVHDI